MPSDKPAHLGPRYGAQFEDRAVVRAYPTRPPYPDDLFDAVGALGGRGGQVLELGCGSGDLSVGLLDVVAHLTVVEPSRHMLDQLERRLERHGSAAVSVHSCAAEVYAPQPGQRFDLVVAAASLHWMEWSVVLPSVARWLVDGGVLAVIDGRSFLPDALEGKEAELQALITAHSTNTEYAQYDLVAELEARGLFITLGSRATTPFMFEQPLEDYVESFHSRNGFSRDRMTAASANMFDVALVEMFEGVGLGEPVRGLVRSRVVWGSPRG